MLENLARQRSSINEVFVDFCRVVACCMAAQTREEEYLDVVDRYSREELGMLAIAQARLVLEMESKPFVDCLGPFYTEINSHAAAAARGEFYTPQEVSEMMAKVTVDAESVIERGLPITVSDPCSGSGGMILALAKQFSLVIHKGEESYVDLLRVSAVDINPVACDMTYINTSLWGIPAKVLRGNTLSMEFDKGWKNIHWARVGEDQRLEMKAQSEQIRTFVDRMRESEPPSTLFPKTEITLWKDGEQFLMDF